MILRPPRSTRTDTLFPYTALFRSLGLGAGRQRLGGSILSQCFDAFGGAATDLDDPQRLRRLFELVRDARRAGLLLAYHDRSDGGAFAALCEMAFCSPLRSEEHTSELQSLMRTPYAVYCLKNKNMNPTY